MQSPAALGFIGVKDDVKTGCTLSKDGWFCERVHYETIRCSSP